MVKTLSAPTIEDLKNLPTLVAPDGLLVKEVGTVTSSSIAQFILPPNFVGRAIQHQSITETWFMTKGLKAEVWIATLFQGKPQVVEVDTYFTIPPQTHFQVRNPSDEEAVFLAVTTPPYPGDQEVEMISGFWETSR